MLTETNTKQTTSIREIINNHLKKLNHNVELIFADSKDYQVTKNEWLPGGTLIVIQGEVIGAMNKESIIIDKIGKWSTFTVSKNNKKVIFITIYWIS